MAVLFGDVWRDVPNVWNTCLPNVPSSFLLLVAMPGATSSVLAPSSTARSP